MRNAVILLVVVALLFVAGGALNQALLFDIDYGFGALLGVSLFWITVVTAGILFLTGLVAALLARSSAVSAQRKLERELQGTYQRLREAEARVSFLSAGVALGGSAAASGPIPLSAREYRAPAPGPAQQRPPVAPPGAGPAGPRVATGPASRPIATPAFMPPAPQPTEVTTAAEPVTTVAGAEAPAHDEEATTVAAPDEQTAGADEAAPTQLLPSAQAEAETVAAGPEPQTEVESQTEAEPETMSAKAEPDDAAPDAPAPGGEDEDASEQTRPDADQTP